MRIEVRDRGVVEVDPDEHVFYSKEVLTGADFSGQRLMQFASEGCRFEQCRFERMRVQHASLGAGVALSEYVDCSFDGSRLTLRGGGYSRFVRCSFRKVDIREWDCHHVDLIDCVFTGKLRNVNMWARPLPDEIHGRYQRFAQFREKRGLGPPTDEQRALMLREVNEIRGNDFSGADLVNFSFRGGST